MNTVGITTCLDYIMNKNKVMSSFYLDKRWIGNLRNSDVDMEIDLIYYNLFTSLDKISILS